MNIFNCRILIVDDEMGWADKIQSILAEQGYQSVVVKYGIVKFKDLLNDYDLAILDIRMPRFNGFQIKNYLKIYSQKTKVILTSQFEDYGLDLLKEAEGADGWIDKKEIEKETFNFLMLVNKIIGRISRNNLSSDRFGLSEDIIVDKRNAIGIETIDKIKLTNLLQQLRDNTISMEESGGPDLSLDFDALIAELSLESKNYNLIHKLFNTINTKAMNTSNTGLIGLIRKLHYSLNKLQFLPKISNDKQKKVFIVHGHDELAKLTLAKYIETLDLMPVILAEQPDRGRTIIEKFEQNTDVSFAVILLTADDKGYKKDNPEQVRFRARQNVILELGYFIAHLGRDRVCALHKDDVEIPSDIHGILYISMDQEGGWKLKLAKEMSRAGIEVVIKL